MACSWVAALLRRLSVNALAKDLFWIATSAVVLVAVWIAAYFARLAKSVVFTGFRVLASIPIPVASEIPPVAPEVRVDARIDFVPFLLKVSLTPRPRLPLFASVLLVVFAAIALKPAAVACCMATAILP